MALEKELGESKKEKPSYINDVLIPAAGITAIAAGVTFVGCEIIDCFTELQTPASIHAPDVALMAGVNSLLILTGEYVWSKIGDGVKDAVIDLNDFCECVPYIAKDIGKIVRDAGKEIKGSLHSKFRNSFYAAKTEK